MDRRQQRIASDERGQALVWALITLTAVTVIIVPFLLFLNTNVGLTGQRYKRVLEIYSTDSGVEYAIHAIQNLSRTLGVDIIGASAVVTLSVDGTPNGTPIPINDKVITATIRNSTPRLPVIFANSQTCDNAIDWGGSHAIIIGDVHSNNDIKIFGASKEMTGTMEYVNQVEGEDRVTFYISPNPVTSTVMPWPLTFNVDDYKPPTGAQFLAAERDGRYFTGTRLKVPPDTLQEGLYYITGNVEIHNSSDITITIVAEGTIRVTGAAKYRPYTDDNLLFFSNKNASSPICDSGDSGVINMAGDDKTIVGVTYAPYGSINLQGSGNHEVKLYGNQVRFRGDGLGSTDPTAGSLLPPGCFYYDIVSESNILSGSIITGTRGTETRARILMCNNEPTVLSWLVD